MKSILGQRLTDLAEKTGRNFRSVSERIDGDLLTTEKLNLPAAVNELATRVPIKVAVGPSPPASPSLNDLWVDTN